MSRLRTEPLTIGPDTPVVVAARRTPTGTAGHGLARVDLAGLLAPVLTAVLADLPAGAGPDEVVIGNCLGPGGNPARYAVLAAGLGPGVPAVTVDRQCGSGQEAVHQGATLVRAGRARLVLAGGAESASTAPYRMFRPTTPTELPRPYQRAPFAPAALGDPDMGAAADDVARRFGITRQRQDAYAARSHALTLAAAGAGAFDAELVPVGGLARDERPRPITRAVLARLRPAFATGSDEDGQAQAAGGPSVTAGNSCGISDGAAVVAIVPEAVRAGWGVPGLALLDWLSVGVDPRWPGVGPVPAVDRLLSRTGLTWGQVTAVEITEAFAAQVLACTDTWGVDPFGDERVCGQGGAIALGHPWGASGALLVVRLFARLVRSAAGPGTDAGTCAAGDTAGVVGYGLATCAVGGGQGLALVARRVGP